MFNGHAAGWSINGWADEADIGDSNVGWSDGGKLCLFIDEGKDGEKRVSSREEDEEKDANFKGFSFGVELEIYHVVEINDETIASRHSTIRSSKW